jgi:hypothetical protein
MPEGELKVKAFEVILNNLLRSGEDETAVGPAAPAVISPRKGMPTARAAAASTRDRILVLKAEGFFSKSRTIGEVRDQLATRGWLYPLSSLSGPLQLLASDELRRQKVSDGGKKVWKYSNK